jgi:hypothetical protein
MPAPSSWFFWASCPSLLPVCPNDASTCRCIAPLNAPKKLGVTVLHHVVFLPPGWLTDWLTWLIKLIQRKLRKRNLKMRSEVLTTLKKLVLSLWFVAPSGLVGSYQRFGGTYCLRLHCWNMFLRDVCIYLSLRTSLQSIRLTLTWT